VLAAVAWLSTGRARADQLVMFRQVGCPYCARWDREVGVTYAKTDEAKLLPLREVDIHAPRPADLASIEGIHYTPTFVVMHCGHEIARITGYLGEDQFWGLLDEAVNEIKEQPKCAR
jgi:thioredoxin-related protein